MSITLQIITFSMKNILHSVYESLSFFQVCRTMEYIMFSSLHTEHKREIFEFISTMLSTSFRNLIFALRFTQKK